ncbi:MAG: glycosyltransferase [Pseudomonadota bacterium]
MNISAAPETPGRIVHVVESFGAGVLQAVRMLANDQDARGLEVHVIHSSRPDTPPPKELAQLFSPGVRRHPLKMSGGIALWQDLRTLAGLIRQLKQLRPDIVHLHSSKAGMLGRAAAATLKLQNSTIYSPHGWAFLRTDVSPTMRRIFLIIEQLAERLFGCYIAACSEHELHLAKERVYARSAGLLRNAVAIPEMPVRRDPDEHVRIITVGRVTEQKAPWHFAWLARELSGPQTHFQWIGDNQHALCDTWLGQAPVQQTGPLGREDLQKALANADIFVLLSGWEGLPLALIEAQAMGLPALITPLPGCLEVVIPEKTGLVADTADTMKRQLLRLIEDRTLRLEMGSAARARMKSEFSFEAYSDRVWQLYSRMARMNVLT